MKNSWLLSFIMVLMIPCVQAQTVVSFMGGSFSNTSMSVTFTGGEVLSGSFENSTLSVTGGFGGITDILTVSNETPDTDLPESFNLSQNYPNPFNPSTNIIYELPQSATIRLEVFNSIGSSVALLEDGVKSAGRYIVQFNASRLASGMYFYRLIANGQVISTQKMLLIK